MVKRHGKCTNIDDDCLKAKSGDVITVEGANEFICPECRSDLFEVPKPKPSRPKWLVPALLLILLVAGGFGLVTIIDGIGGIGGTTTDTTGKTVHRDPPGPTPPTDPVKSNTSLLPRSGVKIENTEECQDCQSYYYVHDGKGGRRREGGNYSTSCCQCGTVKRFSDGYDYSITCDGDRIIAKMITSASNQDETN
ncbi:hypothetical protein [Telluribacter sp. SYSU D00476]|uniref:hypothetical protein n=1 Tax=Telluribacter sp. SYSU D00476 TaxID=2811430 RepID=UPI001FF1FE24|nr:hypothetical protein [Telluribacter sp. SYSU D00476]